MPRLTNTDYLSAHRYLKDAWKVHDGVAFGLLLWHEQRALHDSFLPTKKLTGQGTPGASAASDGRAALTSTPSGENLVALPGECRRVQ
jgi:hypothetical protein